MLDVNARNFYLQEAAEQNWSVSTLERNISTLYYQRIISSQKKELVLAEMKEKTAPLQNEAWFIAKETNQRNSQKKLTLDKTRKLHQQLNIPTELQIKEYKGNEKARVSGLLLNFL